MKCTLNNRDFPSQDNLVEKWNKQPICNWLLVENTGRCAFDTDIGIFEIYFFSVP